MCAAPSGRSMHRKKLRDVGTDDESTSLGGGGRDSWVGEQGRRTMNTQVGGLPRICINHSHGEAIINILANPWQGSGHGEWEQCPRSSASKARAAGGAPPTA